MKDHSANPILLVSKYDSLPELLNGRLAVDFADVVLKEWLRLVERDAIVRVPAFVVGPSSIWAVQRQKWKL